MGMMIFVPWAKIKKSGLMRFGIILLFLSFLVFSCQKEKRDSWMWADLEIRELPVASVSSGEPNLTLSQKGDVFLSWLERVADTTAALRFSRLEEQTWGEPGEVARGNNWFVNWADFPSLAVFPGQDRALAAHWLQKRAAGTYDYDVHIAISQDGGQRWSPSFIPHRDSVAAEHGFVSMAPLPNGRLLAVWLDGRNTKSTSGHTDHDHTGGGPMTLRSAEFDVSGQLFAEVELDNRVCDCCQTDVAMTKSGPIVVYRNRTEEEVRDIAVIRRTNGQWSEPQVLGHDHWEIMGCPVNGPAIAAQGNSVAVAWFTGAGEDYKVQVIFSQDGGETFSAPRRIDEGNPLGRVDIVWMDEGHVLVSWVEERETGGKIKLARVEAGRGEYSTFDLAGIDLSRQSGFPILEKSGEDYLLAFTEVRDTGTRVRSLLLAHD